jgi:hypothetical protein
MNLYFSLERSLPTLALANSRDQSLAPAVRFGQSLLQRSNLVYSGRSISLHRSQLFDEHSMRTSMRTNCSLEL